MLTYGFCLGPEGDVYGSEAFSRAFESFTGSGVCAYGSEFSPSVEGLTLTLGSGFALVGGRWVKNDGPLPLSVPPADSHGDRLDLAAAQVDVEEKRVKLLILQGVDLDALPPDTLPLFSIRVKRGATNLLEGDLTDLRVSLPELSQISPGGLRAYAFTNGGMDREVDRILALGDAVLAKGDQAVKDLDKTIAQAGGMPETGELTTGRQVPGEGWLLCDGGRTPPEYQELFAMVGATLPTISQSDPRLSTWIYGGQTVPVEEAFRVYRPQGRDGYQTTDENILCCMR